jgi:ubiquinone/menaquinone biosynthesis C-methylase UbiE
MAALFWHPTTHHPSGPAPDLGAAAHRSRAALERILQDPHDDAAWQQLAEYYDRAAEGWEEWTETQRPWYASPVEAGLAHAKQPDVAVEVSCGSGQATPLLDGYASRVVAIDTSAAMLADAPRELPRTRYAIVDVRRMPFRTGSVQLLVGLNAVPHPPEFARVLAPTGQLLWCTSFGAGTPLYVEPERFADLFGPQWRGEAGRAGHGEWLLLTRTG